MTQHDQMELQDYIDELTRPHTHREPYQVRLGTTTYTQHHITEVPPLLHQLRYASPSGTGDERSAAGYESRPAASLDALDTLTFIDQKVSEWLRDLGATDPLDTISCLRRLNSLARSHPEARAQIERDVKHWWTQARVMTGWDSPAWRPDNTCPMCGIRGTLRVKLIDQVGLCVDCKESWDPGTIGLLAEHIRLESAGERTAPRMVHCWCPVPRPHTDAWPSLCPSCASPWCHRAGWVSALDEPVGTPEHPHLSDLDGRMGA